MYIEKEKPRVLGKHEHFKKLEVMGRRAIKWHVNNIVLITLKESLVYNRVYFNLI